MKKRFLSTLLAVLMVLSMLPGTAMAAATPLKEGVGLSFNYGQYNKDGYRFTPSKSGYYIFEVKGNLLVSSCISVYTSATSTADTYRVPSTRTYYDLMKLEAGKTYTVRISGTYFSQTCTILATYMPASTLTSSAKCTPDVRNLLEYTPPRAGWYTFSSGSSGRLTIYDNRYDRVCNGDPGMTGVSTYLPAGKKILIEYYPGSTGDLKVAASSFPKVTATSKATLRLDEGKCYATFTPTATDSYTITAKAAGAAGGVGVIWIYDSAMNEIAVNGDKILNASMDVTTNLTANKTYYIQVSGEGNVNVTATGKNAAKTYKITLNANGGTVAPASLQVESGKTYYSKLPTPTREGYEFDGWYTSKTGTVKITATTKATANRTIYAHWTKAAEEDENTTQLVKFNANGGSVFLRSKTVLRGTRYRDLPTPTRPGYHFQGWYTKPNGGTPVKNTTYVTAAGDHTLYAHWTKTAPKPQSTKLGSYTVYIPPYYKLPLYSSQTTAVQVKTNPAQAKEYSIKCTKMVTLSNGTVRYFGNAGGTNRWFQFTCEMDVD